MKTLWVVILIIALALPAGAETTLTGRLFSVRESITLNGLNITDTFNVPVNWNPVEVRAAWVNPARLDLSYTYRSRRAFDGAGIPPKGFMFRDTEFQIGTGANGVLAMSGAVQVHTVDARVLSWAPWIAPVVRWQYVDIEASFTGKTKGGRSGDAETLTDHWTSSSVGLGACAGWRYGAFWLEGNGLVYVNRSGHEVGVQALYGYQNYSIGAGYRYEQNTVGPVSIQSQGPFVAVGVRF